MAPTLKGLTFSKVGPVRAVISSSFLFRRFHLRLFTVSRFAGVSAAARPSSQVNAYAAERGAPEELVLARLHDAQGS